MVPRRNPKSGKSSAALAAITDVARSPELYRQIFGKLDIPAHNPTVIGVTSAVAGEGRSTVALGLARVLADDSDLPVVLVEVDLDNPVLATYFGMAPSPGLAEVLQGQSSLADVMRPVADNLFAVTASAGDDSPRLINRLAQNSPFHPSRRPPALVILDLPPILNHGYGGVAAQVADVLVLVVRAGVTPVELVREAVSRLGDHSPRGVVLNGAISSLPSWWPENT